MRNNTLKQWVLAVLFLLMPWVANAAGLGRLSVLSSLGQPLKAEIDLVSVGKDELATLSTRLASPDAYKQANLQYGPLLIGLRLNIDKRPNGEPYIKVTSTRPVNEPFIDLLVELDWAAGRITREYTALIDPPDFASAPVATRPAPVLQAPAAAAAPVARSAVAAPAKMGEKEYGPIKRGETLFRIANSMKPEGVTLEQMLVGLYRSNPDAFEKNMNRMKSGKILRVPEKEELAAVPQREAMKEYRTQVADWNAYRRRLADAAAAAPESRSAASGKITARVEEGAAAGGAKDVVRLSKGEPPKGASGKQGDAADRVRTLEEEAIAREKALGEANERVAQLEKNIKDMQRLLEIKNSGMAAVQQKAETKPETAAAGTPVPEAKKDEPKAAAAPSSKPAAEAKVQPAPKAKPKVVPPPESSLVDTLLGEPLYLAAGGGVILLGLGLWLARRRRAQAAPDDDDEPVRLAPSLAADFPREPGKTTGGEHGGAAAVAAAAVAGTTAAMADASADEVDPLAEAEVYIAYGRDTQAEEILGEALAKNPQREDVRLKLLEIYAARKDKIGFNGVAGGFHELTGGQGENWLKVAAMGYALDPGNPLYEAGKSAPIVGPFASSPTSTDVDFDLGQSEVGLTSTDITLDPGMAQHEQMERTAMMDPGAMKAMASEAEKAETEASAPLMPDFTLEIPNKGSSSAAGPGVTDLNIELPKIDVPEPGAPGQQGHESGSGLDFKLDIGDINLNLDDQPKAGAAAAEGEKDAHWYDVQTKFDLAKAYQEMGDKEGANEILQEVIREGDAGQQAEAKKFLETLH